MCSDLKSLSKGLIPVSKGLISMSNGLIRVSNGLIRAPNDLTGSVKDHKTSLVNRKMQCRGKVVMTAKAINLFEKDKLKRGVKEPGISLQ